MNDLRIYSVSGDDPNEGLKQDFARELREIRDLVEKLGKAKNGGGNGTGNGYVRAPLWLVVPMVGVVLSVLSFAVTKVIQLARTVAVENLRLERDMNRELQRVRDGCPTPSAERRLQRLESQHDLDAPLCVRN